MEAARSHWAWRSWLPCGRTQTAEDRAAAFRTGKELWDLADAGQRPVRGGRHGPLEDGQEKPLHGAAQGVVSVAGTPHRPWQWPRPRRPGGADIVLAVMLAAFT